MTTAMGRVLLGLGLLAAASGPAWAVEPEPNQDRASAPSISNDLALAEFAPSGVVTVDGALEDGDVDHFAFGVRAGEPVSLALFEDANGELHDALLVVFDGDGAELASNDDGGPGFFSRLLLLPGADDEWTVAVTRAPDPGRDGDRGEPFGYRLVVAAAGPGAQPDADAGSPGANDGDATAQPFVGSAGVVTGSLVPGDRDVFAFPAAVGELVTVSVFEPDAGEFHDSVVRLRRAGAGLAADDDAGPGRLSNLGRRVGAGEDGTWLLELTGFASPPGAPHQQAFAYQLVVSAAAAAARLCDANGDAAVDRRDLDAIFLARGAPATGLGDPRDADADGTITVLDARRCAASCDRPDCSAAPSCGVGAELLAVLVALGWRMRSVRARREDAR